MDQNAENTVTGVKFINITTKSLDMTRHPKCVIFDECHESYTKSQQRDYNNEEGIMEKVK